MLEDRFTDPQTLVSPYEYFDEIRQEEPLFFSPAMDAYVVTRYADIMAVLEDPGTFSSAPRGDVNFMANFAPRYDHIYHAAGVPPHRPTLVTTDGAMHKRYRGHVDRFFNASSVKAMEDRVRVLVDMLIDEFIDDGAVDFYQRFCLRLPLYLICDMLGFPWADAARMQAAADASVRLAGGAGESEEGRVALHEETAQFFRYVLDHIQRVRAAPDGTLLSAIIHTVPPDGQPMADWEILSYVNVFNAGGNETTTNGLGNMFWLAFSEPGRLDALNADRHLIPRYAEEALRLQSPVSALPRWALKDSEVAGTPIPAGSVLQLNFAACNRDPEKFGCPMTMDLERKGMRTHVAFGMGAHYCLGAILARMEMKVAMERLLDRMDDVVIDAPVLPVHQPKIVVRGLSTLPIRFARRAGT